MQVFINDKSEEAIKTMVSSCAKNDIAVSAVHLQGLTRTKDGSAEHQVMEIGDSLVNSSDEENSARSEEHVVGARPVWKNCSHVKDI